jgi:NADH-quinone oxidoreductase subunit H
MEIATLTTSLIKIVLVTFVMILPMVAYSVYAERRVSAIIQDRVGPNRTGIPLTLFGGKKDLPFAGLFQPLADGLKFILKEDFTPGHVNKFFFWLAPVLTMVPALLMCAVLPVGSWVHIPFTDTAVPAVIADLDIGPLWVFAVSSLGVYGIVLAGWSSNSKYPFFGGVRSSSQMISYEIALGLSVVPVLMVFGELNLGAIARYQDTNGWLLFPAWGDGLSLGRWLLLVPMGISFVVFTTSVFAETNRLPFDLPECETELVAGYHTEYSSMKFALFFLGEYAAMIIGSGMIVTLFFGGWSVPFAPQLGLTAEAARTSLPVGLVHIAAFLVKVVAFIVFFIWVRWSLPRFRYDQLMKLGWVYFFEIALANIFLTAAVLIFVR